MAPFTRIFLAATLMVAVLIAPTFASDDGQSPMGDMNATDHDHEKVMEEAGATVGIEEKLGNILADVELTDSEGNRVSLRELTADIPTILIPIYYRCPDVCNVLQGSFAQILPDEIGRASCRERVFRAV